jgi:hypothetical protein
MKTKELQSRWDISRFLAGLLPGISHVFSVKMKNACFYSKIVFFKKIIFLLISKIKKKLFFNTFINKKHFKK